jgi:hypothetical protein
VITGERTRETSDQYVRNSHDNGGSKEERSATKSVNRESSRDTPDQVPELKETRDESDICDACDADSFQNKRQIV